MVKNRDLRNYGLIPKHGCDWQPHGKKGIEAQEIGTEMVEFDLSATGDYIHDNSQEIIDQLIKHGFTVVSQMWEDVWGQGDGRWNHCILRMGDIQIETTIERQFLITIDSRGNEK